MVRDNEVHRDLTRSGSSGRGDVSSGGGGGYFTDSYVNDSVMNQYLYNNSLLMKLLEKEY